MLVWSVESIYPLNMSHCLTVCGIWSALWYKARHWLSCNETTSIHVTDRIGLILKAPRHQSGCSGRAGEVEGVPCPRQKFPSGTQLSWEGRESKSGLIMAAIPVCRSSSDGGDYSQVRLLTRLSIDPVFIIRSPCAHGSSSLPHITIGGGYF